MTTILYKRLFEVRILHGYYLDGHVWDNNSKPVFFQEYPPEKQAEILGKGYNILSDLEILPTEATVELMRRLQMRWQATATGFFAGIEAISKGNAGFAPKITLPEGATWTFLLRVRNPYFYNITNHTLRAASPGRYLFTNRNDDVFNKRDAKDFKKKNPPNLSVAPPAFDAARTWEMGELALKSAKLNIARDGKDVFVPLTNHQWANTNDRVALPKSFPYRFDPKWTDIQQATFTLHQLDNAKLSEIKFDFTNGFQREVSLDFSYLPKQAGQNNPKPLPNGFYYLHVASQAGALEKRWVNLRSDMPAGDAVFGLVEIVHQSAQTDDFRLLDTAPGAPQLLRLQAAASNPNLFLPAPFEIRLLRRETYWRYFIQKDIAGANINPELELDKAAKKITTKDPRPLLQARIRLSADASKSVFLPTPTNPALNYDHDMKRYFTDLFLQTIKLS